MIAATPIQDYLPSNHCFGCGPANEQGLRIKSYWQPDTATAVCEFVGLPHHNAGVPHVLNGGIIATVMDCHSICTAVAAAYSAAGLELGAEPLIWYVTGGLTLDYHAPAPLGEPVRLTARVLEAAERRSAVSCELRAGATLCVSASLTAVRVPPGWREPR